MTESEAIEFLRRYDNEAYTDKCRLAHLIGIAAINKQIARKPINKTRPDDTASLSHENCNIIVCPYCNRRLKLKSKGKHCDKCGQALDWGGDDDE